MVYGTGETGSQTTTGVAILSADVWSLLEFWVWGPKKILFWEKAASAK